MKILKYIFLFSVLISRAQNYNPDKPDKVCTLPWELHEVSGVTVVDSARLACVQDENGFIYILNAISCQVLQKYSFASDGDYEGIACVGNTMYVLRSDGVIFEVNNYELKTRKVTVYPTGIPANNNEGLCYDKAGNRLLIGCKSKSGKGPGYKYFREIYAFDLSRKKLLQQPVYKFELNELLKAVEQKQIPVPIKEKKHGAEPVLKFTISALAIHPVTKQLYVVSSADKLIFVFNEEGKVQDVIRLDATTYTKPEGIIFLDNGTMIITNEGQNGKPTLLRVPLKDPSEQKKQ
jgi:uncharacterized protein YjiK